MNETRRAHDEAMGKCAFKSHLVEDGSDMKSAAEVDGKERVYAVKSAQQSDCVQPSQRWLHFVDHNNKFSRRNCSARSLGYNSACRGTLTPVGFLAWMQSH